MKKFRAFTLQEEVRASHAAKFMNYEEKYHHKLAMEARRNLIEAWKEVITPIYVNPDRTAAVLEKNPKASVKLEVIEEPERFSSTRWAGSKLIGPSVKIPAFFPIPDRAAIAKRLLQVSKESLERLVKRAARILELDNGDLQSLFRVVADEDDVRLQFVSSKSGLETAKTIFKVALEHGRPNSKTRDFDRVYFVDNLLKAY